MDDRARIDRDENLSALRLADESDTDERYIERLVELGILDSQDGAFRWTDVWRIRTMRSLESRGMQLERIAPHFQSGRLSLEFLEHALQPPSPRTGRTFGEFATSLGERAPLAGSAYEMLGLARPANETPTRVDEEAMIAELVDLWAEDPQVMRRAARIAGHAVRSVVEGWTGLHVELYREIGGGGRQHWPPGLRERETVNAGRAMRLAEQLPSWLTTRHYEEVLYSDILENIEMVLDPFEERPTDRQGVRQPSIVFIDLSGFTAMTEAEGDRVASSVTARFEETVALATLAQGGRVVKLLGDGALLHFADVLPAVQATLEVRSTLADLPLRPHAGIACGSVSERDGDVFGRTVNMASRLASAASDRQILGSAAVARVAREAGIPVRDLGARRLKGMAKAVDVYLLAEAAPPTSP